MPKNAYFFLKKIVKLLQHPGAPSPNPLWPPAAGDFVPRLSALLLPLTDIDLSKVRFYRKPILLL